MPVTDSAAEKRLEPLVLVDTVGLTEEEWLSYRRRGIGGSDVALFWGFPHGGQPETCITTS